ncbi:MAG: hypothetical protein N2491_12700 [Negativicutes bacterium]|nr:hypothetical protein [Negativicutes bacterium]
MNKQGITLRELQTLKADSHLGTRRHLLLPLISALSRRHRRIWYIYGLRGNPMNDYLQDSLAMERDHMAELTSMIETIL